MSFQFPETQEILRVVLDGQTIDGHGPLTVYYQLQTDFPQHLPALQIIEVPGVDNFVEREDRFRLSMYAEGQEAKRALKAVFDFLLNTWHAAEGIPGMIDRVESRGTPADVPYASDRINQADAVIGAVVRAL